MVDWQAGYPGAEGGPGIVDHTTLKAAVAHIKAWVMAEFGTAKIEVAKVETKVAGEAEKLTGV